MLVIMDVDSKNALLVKFQSLVKAQFNFTLTFTA